MISPLMVNIFFAAAVCADLCPPKIQRGYGHPHQACAPEGTVDLNGTKADYGLRSSYGVGYAVRG